MDNKLQLNLNVEPCLSFSYSSSGDKVEHVANPRIALDIKLGKNSAGTCYLSFEDIIAEHTQFNKKSKFDKELTVMLYEKMIADLNEQIAILKK